MAKLSAHGYELLRVEQTTPLPDDRDADMERTCVSVRSDGHIMRRFVTHFPSHEYRSEQKIGGRTYVDRNTGWHDYGWKLWKRVKRDGPVTPQEYARGYASRIRARMEADPSLEMTISGPCA